MYIPPFARLSHCMQIDQRAGTVTMPEALFKKFLAVMATESGCDAAWYGAAYGDISKAIADGEIIDPLRHFTEAGYFEGRKQRAFHVDEDWYLTRYPDIAASIRAGRIASAHAHYNTTGYFEGRVPSAALEAEIEGWNSLIEQYTISFQDKQRA